MGNGLSWRLSIGLIILFFSLLFEFSAATAADLIENVGEGRINWSLGLVTANGIGAPPKDLKNPAQIRAMTQRAAITVARRNLLEVLKGVRIDSNTKVENFILSSDVIKTQVSGILQGSQVMQTRYFSDGSIEVTVGVYVKGELASVLMPPSRFPSTPASPSPPLPDKSSEKRVGESPSVLKEEVSPSAREIGKEPATASIKELLVHLQLLKVREIGKEPATASIPPPPAPKAKREEGKEEALQKIESSPSPAAEKPLEKPVEKKVEITDRTAPDKAPEAPATGPPLPSSPSRSEVAKAHPPAPLEKKAAAPEEIRRPEAKTSPAPSPVIVTGLVVDARALDLKPALLPRILDEGGGEIYSTNQVNRQAAIEQGLVGYAKDVSAAQRNIRVTDKPLLVKGIKAIGKEKTDVIISDPDAASVVAAISTSNFLEKSRVIIVYN